MNTLTTHSTGEFGSARQRANRFSLTVFVLVLAIGFPIGQTKAGFLDPDSLAEIAQVRPGSNHLRFLPETNIPARDLFTLHGSKFGLGGFDRMVLVDSTLDEDTDLMHYHFRQLHNGIRVEGAEMRVREAQGRSVSANGLIIPDLEIGANPALTEEQALAIALGHIDALKYMWEIPEMEAELQEDEDDSLATYFPTGRLAIETSDTLNDPTLFRLCYKFKIFAAVPRSHDMVYVDASTGHIVFAESLIEYTTATALTIYDGAKTIETEYDSWERQYRLMDNTRGSGIRIRDSRGKSSTSSADDIWHEDTYWEDNGVSTQAMYSLQASWDYFYEVHGREGWNGSGKIVKAYVNFDSESDGGGKFIAAFDGSHIMFDDDDFPTSGNTPAVGINTAGHEFTHGVTGTTANLSNRTEPNSLEEGFSDIFGAAIEWWARPGDADWEHGADNQLDGDGRRDLKNTANHTYQGDLWDDASIYGKGLVLGHWFYLVSDGGTGTNDFGTEYSVDGVGIEHAARITFKTLTLHLTRHADFKEVRDESVQVAEDLYGSCSPEHYAVVQAWRAVGLGDPIFVENWSPILSPYVISNEFGVVLGPNFSVETGHTLYARSMTQVRILPETEIKRGSEFTAKIGCE